MQPTGSSSAARSSHINVIMSAINHSTQKYNTAQNSPDNLPSYSPDNHHMLSMQGDGRNNINKIT